MPNDASPPSAYERKLADLAVERGFLTRNQVNGCLSARSADPGASLEVMFVTQGYLTEDEALDLSKAAWAAAEKPAAPAQEKKKETTVRREPEKPGTPEHRVLIYGACTVIEHIGRGPTGNVYRAYHAGQASRVALKVIRVNSLNGPFIEKFEARSRRATGLAHPNVAQVVEVGRHPDALFVASELLNGIPVSSMVLQQGRLELPLAIAVLKQVAAALQSAHNMDVIHGNLKPENIFVVGSRQVKVTDWGLARDDAEFLKDRADLSGALVFSLAPEQWVGEAVPATDLYQAGVLWNFMLTGKHPFAARHTPTIRKNHEKGQSKPPRAHRPELPPAVDTIYRALVQFDFEKRYAEPLELADDLERLEKGQVPRGVGRTTSRVRKTSRKSTVKRPPLRRRL